MRSRLAVQKLPILLVSILSSLSYFAHADCFHPNGTRTTDLLHRPCSNDPSNPLSLICCALARPNPAGGLESDGVTSDVCLPNGICMNQKQPQENDTRLHTEYFREECTSKDWKSGKCPEFCQDNVSTSYPDGYMCIRGVKMSQYDILTLSSQTEPVVIEG
jgi:hypothetical protein